MEENTYELSIDVPGVMVEDIEIEFDSGVISIKTKRRKGCLTQTRQELFYAGSTFSMAAARARLNHGVLTIVLLKISGIMKRKITVE